MLCPFFVISVVPCSEGLSGLRSPVQQYKSLRADRGGKSRTEHDMAELILCTLQVWQPSFSYISIISFDRLFILTFLLIALHSSTDLRGVMST